MNNLNSILIEGNLVRDPLIRRHPHGQRPVCSFSIASSRFFNDGEGKTVGQEVCYFDVEVWDRPAESCCNIGKKGRGVRVVGRLRQDRWTDGDGKNHARIVVVAEHVEFRPEFKKRARTAETLFPDFEADVPPDEELAEEPALCGRP